MVELPSLPKDIHNLLNGADLTSSINKFKDELGDMMLARFSEDIREPSLRMSNIGRPYRQLWYELNGYPGEELSGQTKFKFLYGHLLEALVLYLAQAAGHKAERFQEELEVDGIKGHIDCVLDGRLIDVKSCSTYSFKKFETGSLFQDDPFGYIGQLAGYAHALNLPASYVAVDKVTGDICILDLPQEVIDTYDVRQRIKDVKEKTKSPEIPDRCYPDVPYQKSGNMKLGTGCSYCRWKKDCWKDANNGDGLREYIYASGPVWLTKIVKEPRVQKADWDFEPVQQ